MPAEWEGAKVPVPDGAYPLFLTATTQTNFKCREREECTSVQPYVFVSKKFFLDDIQFRGVISDFHPTKKFIEKYPDDTDVQEDGTSGLLIVWDEEEDYGQNFYLVHKVELKDQIIEKYTAKAEAPGGAEGRDGGKDSDEADAEEYVAPISKPWVSQGSEAEIAEEAVLPTRDRFVVRVWRARREFGRRHTFSNRESHEDPCLGDNDCRPFKDAHFGLERRELTVGVQAIRAAVVGATQTAWNRPMNKGLQYAPLTKDAAACEAVEQSPEFTAFLKSVRGLYEVALQQNETVDIVEDDFAALAEEEAGLGNKSDSDLRELQSFSHLNYCAGRIIAATDWQPVPRALVVAVSCAQRLNFEERVLVSGKVHTGYVLLWSFADPITPQFVLHAPGDVFAFKFCPSNPDIVVGGVTSGQVVVWDLAKARTAAIELRAITGDEATPEEGGSRSIMVKPMYVSAVDASHRATVTDVAWLPHTADVSDRGRFGLKAEPGKQERFATMAGDGQLLFWDVARARELTQAPVEGEEGQKKKKEGWGPTYRMPLTIPGDTKEQRGVLMALDLLESAEAQSSLLCGSEEGDLVVASLANPGSEGPPRGVTSVLPSHCSPCTALHKSPFVKGVHMTVGDWTFNIWKEGVTAALFSSPFASALLTCGCWSPTRPGVLVVGKTDGGIDVWDLMDRSHEPSTSVTVASAAITSLQFHVSGSKQLLAIGDDRGTVHVMEVPRNLRRLASHEKTFVANFFAREAMRVAYSQARAELRKEAAGADETRPAVADTTRMQDEEDEEEREAAEKASLEIEFRALENKFLQQMGLRSPPPEEPA